MKGMTPRQVARCCGGLLHLPAGSESAADMEILSVVIDSREAARGCLFAAIVGERVDGHDFAAQVFEKGALCVLSEKDLPQAAGPWIRVESTMKALQDIAAWYRKQMGIPVVGITGSVGKTSTKEMIAAVLSQKYRVLKTQGNYNNELGVPLTLFRLTPETQIAVVEMGISSFGEMHRLARMARPDTCVITNIGYCHLEFLGDRDGVLRAKTEIFDFLGDQANIILNGDDDKLRTVKEVKGIRPVFFGTLPPTEGRGPHPTLPPTDDSFGLDVWADQVEPKGLQGIFCRIHTSQGSFEVTVPIPGQHMVMNAMAATAVGLVYGLTLEQIRCGIESVEGIGGRFHIIETEKYTIIDDCYNANPMSMKASLGILGDAPPRRVALLGDMFELGPDEMELHREVGRYASSLPLELLIGVGSRCKGLVEEAGANKELRTRHFDTLEELLQELEADKAGDTLLRQGDTILVKASHGMQFAGLIEKLQTL